MSSLLNHRLPYGFSPTYPTPSSTTTKTHTPKRISPKGISITSQTSQPGRWLDRCPVPATRWQKHTHRLVPKRWLSTKRNRNKGMCELPLWSNCRFFGGGLVPTKNRQVFVSQKQLRQWPPSCLSTVGAIKAQNQQIFIALPKIRFEATRCQMPTGVATHYHLAICVTLWDFGGDLRMENAKAWSLGNIFWWCSSSSKFSTRLRGINSTVVWNRTSLLKSQQKFKEKTLVQRRSLLDMFLLCMFGNFNIIYTYINIPKIFL